MPLEEVEQYQSDSGIDEAERHSDSVECGQTFQADDDDTSLDDEYAMQKDVDSSDSASHTPAQKSKRRLPNPQKSKRRLPNPRTPSDSEEFDIERDELYPPQRKTGFSRPRTLWNNVAEWNLQHNNQEDIDGEIARIMAKSMKDAQVNVTPKTNSHAISDFRLKQVRIVCMFHFYLT
jgi:hypothetical protein